MKAPSEHPSGFRLPITYPTLSEKLSPFEGLPFSRSYFHLCRFPFLLERFHLLKGFLLSALPFIAKIPCSCIPNILSHTTRFQIFRVIDLHCLSTLLCTKKPAKRRFNGLLSGFPEEFIRYVLRSSLQSLLWAGHQPVYLPPGHL